MNRIGSQLDHSGQKLLLKNTFANVPAATTDASGIAAVPGKIITLLGVFAHLAGDTPTNLTLNSKGSGAGTAISSTKQVAANGGWVQTRGCSTDFLYKTKRGEALTFTTGAGSTIGIDILYAETDD